ncbi:MAG TPA: enoyl-CoA hydratase/isomerase family protein [Ramlibacter sp.]|nr:enoyl-CoA hydratase/isomerase family protein [Ramlibacter sp.]
MNDDSPVRLERRGTTALVTIDSPGTRNAFTPAVKDGIAAAIAQVNADRALRAVVLTGAGGHFSAGGDVRGMARAERTGAEWLERMRDMNRFIRELILLDRPVIAAIDGAAYGGGFSVALAADFVLATPRARFCMPFMKIGLVPDCGATYTLPRAVGMSVARQLMLSGREMLAAEALQLGIVAELHEPEQLLPRALAIADSFADASPLAVSLLKRNLIDAGALDQLLDAEANAQALAFNTAEHRDAVRRFVDKQQLAFQWPHLTNPT